MTAVAGVLKRGKVKTFTRYFFLSSNASAASEIDRRAAEEVEEDAETGLVPMSSALIEEQWRDSLGAVVRWHTSDRLLSSVALDMVWVMKTEEKINKITSDGIDNKMMSSELSLKQLWIL